MKCKQIKRKRPTWGVICILVFVIVVVVVGNVGVLGSTGCED